MFSNLWILTGNWSAIQCPNALPYFSKQKCTTPLWLFHALLGHIFSYNHACIRRWYLMAVAYHFIWRMLLQNLRGCLSGFVVWGCPYYIFSLLFQNLNLYSGFIRVTKAHYLERLLLLITNYFIDGLSYWETVLGMKRLELRL